MDLLRSMALVPTVALPATHFLALVPSPCAPAVPPPATAPLRRCVAVVQPAVAAPPEARMMATSPLVLSALGVPSQVAAASSDRPVWVLVLPLLMDAPSLGNS